MDRHEIMVIQDNISWTICLHHS